MKGGLDLVVFDFRIEGAALASEVEGEGVQQQHRGGHRLGTRDGDLGSGAEVEGGVGDTGGLRAGRVAEGDLGAAGAACLVHGGESVDGFAGLGDGDDERALIEDGLAVAELGGVIDLGGDAGEAFEVVAADERGVRGGAHADEDGAIDRLDLGGREWELVELNAGGVDQVTAAERVEDGVGLLVDLLEHEVLVAAAGGGDVVVRGDLDRLLDRAAGGVDERHAGRGEVDELARLEEVDAPRVSDQRAEVGRDVHLSVAVSDDEAPGVADARGDDAAGRFTVSGDQRVGAVGVGDDRAQRLEQIGAGLEAGAEHVGEHLGVGVGGEGLGGEAGAEGLEVLDDAVVDDGDAAGGVEVGVRVAVARFSVGRPTGVADRGGGGRELALGVLDEGVELAGGAGDVEFAVVLDQGDARGVIAAVFEAAEAVEHDRTGRALPAVANDSTHAATPCCPAAPLRTVRADRGSRARRRSCPPSDPRMHHGTRVRGARRPDA